MARKQTQRAEENSSKRVLLVEKFAVRNSHNITKIPILILYRPDKPL